MDKRRSLQRLSEEIRDHIFRWTVGYSHISGHDGLAIGESVIGVQILR